MTLIDDRDDDRDNEETITDREKKMTGLQVPESFVSVTGSGCLRLQKTTSDSTFLHGREFMTFYFSRKKESHKLRHI